MGLFVDNRDRGLLLEHCAGVTFRGEEITPAKLEEDTRKWQEYAVLLYGRTSNIGDETILRQLICGYMPFIIIGDHREDPVTLDAELARFPYRGRLGEGSYPETFAVRLIPTTGRIVRIFLHPSSLAVNYLDNQEDHVSIGLGNGSLHLEVYSQPQGKNVLPPLSPFEEHRSFERLHMQQKTPVIDDS